MSSLYVNFFIQDCLTGVPVLTKGLFKIFCAVQPRHSDYNTGKNQADGVFIKVPHFATSVHKSSKHFGLSFAYDAPKIWNDLSDDVSSKEAQNLFLKTSISTLISPFPGFSPWCCLAMSRVNDYSSLLFFWFGAPKICLYMEIKHYKNTIRIKITLILKYFNYE